MTLDEISKLSNEQLNELIAKQRGYIHNSDGRWIEKDGYPREDYFLPNYCERWQWAGELLGEMPVETRLVNFEDDTTGNKFWVCTIVNLVYPNNADIYCQADTPQRAIAEAYAIMECVG